MGKSLNSDSARARSQRHQKERRNVTGRTRGSASLPSSAERLGPIISEVHTNDPTLTRNKILPVSPFLERFLDTIVSAGYSCQITSDAAKAQYRESPRGTLLIVEPSNSVNAIAS